jgi:hypothetical protein
MLGSVAESPPQFFEPAVITDKSAISLKSATSSERREALAAQASSDREFIISNPQLLDGALTRPLRRILARLAS